MIAIELDPMFLCDHLEGVCEYAEEIANDIYRYYFADGTYVDVNCN